MDPKSHKKPKRPKPKVRFNGPMDPTEFISSPSPTRRPAVDPTIQLNISESITLNNKEYPCTPNDFTKLTDLGRGAFGQVQCCRHEPTGTEIAIKIISYTFNNSGDAEKLRDLDISMRLGDCPYAIRIYGALYTEGDVWICMELMKTSLDKFYQQVKEQNKLIPEEVLGRIAFSVVSALEYLHADLQVIHRDVKPSNILINDIGDIKLCDFGVSGVLVNSLAKSNVGSKPYLAPERIEPSQGTSQGYDVRSDVWSLGITMLELACLQFPYANISSPFDQIVAVVMKPSPSVPKELGYSGELIDFVDQCLMKGVENRPRYKGLLLHPYLCKHQHTPQSVVAEFMKSL